MEDNDHVGTTAWTPTRSVTPTHRERPVSTSASTMVSVSMTSRTPQAMAVLSLAPDEIIDLRTPRRPTRGFQSDNDCSIDTKKKGNDGDIDVISAEVSGDLKTPAATREPCAICLSPMLKSGGKPLYTVKLCRHDFHRSCLTESRRAGNASCPCCRGDLEKGLTPSTATVRAESGAAVTVTHDSQRRAIRQAAARARRAIARYHLRHQIVPREPASPVVAASSPGERDNPIEL